MDTLTTAQISLLESVAYWVDITNGVAREFFGETYHADFDALVARGLIAPVKHYTLTPAGLETLKQQGHA